MQLAYEVVSLFYSQEQADQAQEAFVRLFQKGSLPEEMPEYTLKDEENVLDVLVSARLVGSKSEGRRLMSQNGVRLDGEPITDPTECLQPGGVLQVGKRHFVRLVK